MDPRVQMVYAMLLARNASMPGKIGSPDRVDNTTGVRAVPWVPGSLFSQLMAVAHLLSTGLSHQGYDGPSGLAQDVAQ